MSTPLSVLSDSLTRAQQLLDDALADRDRLNRRIRRIRSLVKAAEEGDDVPELDAMIAAMRQPSPSAPPPSAGAARPRLAPSAPQTTPRAPEVPLGVPASGGVAPSPSSLDSVDVGALKQMDDATLDSLPYGVVTLDSEGRIIGYNDTESRMVGLRPDAVLGRSFFGDVAPCTRVRDFEGRFEEFVSRGTVGIESFDFVFRFASGDQYVTILFTPGPRRGTVRVCMLRR